ncbi:MAG: ImmA/IrrE family metallo-endopeptidase [Cyanobacteria bacterium]|nr:ImmA/IrrE family metallo-endopeptidase [Cyanobacteriota bacterium]
MTTANVLDSIDPRRLGDLLQQARKKMGMTQADAARVIDAARTTLVAIEKGERRLKPNELIQLARAYGRSVSDFVRPTPAIEPFEVQFRAVYHRQEQEELQINPVIEHFEQLCRNYLELEQIMDAPMTRTYPPEYRCNTLPLEAAAENIALAERQRLGLGDGPLPLLRDILEISVGIRVFYLKMPPKYSEIYSYDSQLGACMAINQNHYEERRRWSMAHGYLHFLAHRHKPVLDFDGQYQRRPESEQLAESFPKYFLMPTSGLLRRFNDMSSVHGKFTTTNLFTLANYYGVSLEALANRLEDLALLPTGSWARLRDRGIKVRKVQQDLGLQETAHRSDQLPVHYQHLAIDALEQGKITEGRFADFLEVDRLEARRIAEELRNHSAGIDDEIISLELRPA